MSFILKDRGGVPPAPQSALGGYKFPKWYCTRRLEILEDNHELVNIDVIGKFGRPLHRSRGKAVDKFRFSCILAGMTQAIVQLPPHNEWGPAVKALTEKQRLWLFRYIDNGGKKAAAAIDAGYPKEWANDTGSKLSRNPSILAAIKEVAESRIRGSAVTAIDVMIQIMNDPTHKDRFRAAIEVANRSGMIVATQHEVKVTTQDDSSTIQRIAILARQLGMDPVKLLGSAGVQGEIIDAEFVEIDPNVAEVSVQHGATVREQREPETAKVEDIAPNGITEDWSWSPDDK